MKEIRFSGFIVKRCNFVLVQAIAQGSAGGFDFSNGIAVDINEEGGLRFAVVVANALEDAAAFREEMTDAAGEYISGDQLLMSVFIIHANADFPIRFYVFHFDCLHKIVIFNIFLALSVYNYSTFNYKIKYKIVKFDNFLYICYN